MPQMGISVAEGTIVEWRKRPGDWVEADEPICDVSTDKVDVEIPSPAAGRLERILAEAGETVSVGTVLAELDAAAAPGRRIRTSSQPAATRRRRRRRRRIARGSTRRSCAGIAAEHGVDLEQVAGSGMAVGCAKPI